MKKNQISSAELEIMQVLWRSEKAMSVQEVHKSLSKWAYKTVATLLMRLNEKGAVSMEKIGKANYYTPLIDREIYKKEQTKALISDLYDGSAKALAVSLLKSDGLTAEDIDDIRKMFEL